MLRNKFLQKGFSIFTGLSLIFQSLLPGLFVLTTPAYAQEATPLVSPEPTAEAGTSTPTDTPTISVDPTEAPTEIPTPTEIQPTNTPEPTPAVETSPTAVPTVTSPPAETITPVPTVTASSEEGVITAAIYTDKSDYSPTEIAEIFGNGFSPNETYTLNITSDDLDVTVDVTADNEGNFAYYYQLDGTYRPLYSVVAKDSSGSILATTSFTDEAPPPSPNPAKFAQCANKNPTAGSCDWIGSIIQTSNSAYFEGMSVPQRIFDGGFGNGPHTIAFSYSYTKGGIHAYDFITGKNQGNGSFTPGITIFNDCQGLTGANLTSCTALIGTAPTLVSIPNDTFDSKDSAPAAGTGTSQTAKELEYGPRSISVYNQGTISGASISPITHSVVANGDTGDSDATLTINFTLADCPSGPGDPGCDVLVYFDGHLAVGGTDNTTGVNWGPGLGSSNISGGPYHIKDVNLDGGGGSLDNQIQGADILVPTGSISGQKFNDLNGNGVKDTGEPGLSGWTINLTGASSATTTTDSSGNYIFSSLANGTYTICEVLQAGWVQTFPTSGASCPGSTLGYSVTTSGAVVTGKDFGNFNLGQISGKKYNDLNQSGEDEAGEPGLSGWTIYIDVNNNGVLDGGDISTTTSGTGSYAFSNLGPGTYHIREVGQTDWAQADPTSADSSIGGTNDGSYTITMTSNGNKSQRNFGNFKKPKLTVIKVTDPTNDNGKFDLSINGTKYATDISNGGTTDAQFANIGANTFAEAAGTGTNLSNYTSVVSGTGCGGTATAGTITLVAGDDKTCTITNTRKGSITIKKVTIGGDASFTFAGDVSGSLSNGQTATQQVVPGTYHSTEAGKSGWALTDISCNDSNSAGVIGTGIATFIVAAGENVICTFTNNKPAAQIDLSPLAATNKVGANHVITATVQTNNGDGVWGPTVDGTLVTFFITNSSGATAVFVPVSPDTCTTTSGSCTTTINSPTAGNVAVHASAGPVILGVTVNVATDGLDENSHDAQKDYVNARISIAPSASTNEVNNEHDFKVKVEQNTGSGFVPVPAGTIANAIVSPSTSLDVSDCTDGVDVLGQCTVKINSSVAGTFTIIARSTVVVGGVTFKLQTNSVAPNSAPAVKTYVDANIVLSPLTATNNIHDAHTITATVSADPGTGFASSPDGTLVTFSLLNNTAGATFVAGNTCITTSGTCSVQINSSTPGSVDIEATTTLSVGGVSLTRTTGDGLSGDSENANKIYEAGRIIIEKQTLPDGSLQLFNFPNNYSSDFQLADGGINNSGFLAPGSYSVSETGLANWDLTSATCDNGDNPSNINLKNGDVVTCTFANTQRGNITIVKDAQPNDLIDFNFTGTLGAFSLDDDAGVFGGNNDLLNSKTFSNKVPGSYTVTETLPNSFWTFGGVTCVNTGDHSPYTSVTNVSNGVTIALDPGADVTCTFVNHKESPTRTLGFWQTHTAYTSGVFAAAPISSNIPIGTTLHKGFITTIGQLFGAFYSSIPKKTDKTNRTPLDKARMQLLQQLVAAKLNCANFGCAGSVHATIATADSNYATGTAVQILASASLLDIFNNSGDTITIGPAGSATPKTSQSLANLVFWNNP